MKKTVKSLAIFAALALSGQFAYAQANANLDALKEIADIVANLNHFPSEEQAASLNEIIMDDSLSQGVQGIASAVAGIQHAVDGEGQMVLDMIQDAPQAPQPVKDLANIIANFNHSVSDEEKAQLAQLFP